MSMEHKAYIFDYDNFAIQLKPILIDALKNNDKENLINFIQINLLNLKDADNNLAVNKVWQNLYLDGDIQELGDFGLTKYYDPDDDIGLNYEWENIFDVLQKYQIMNLNTILLGESIEYKDSYFDPGKMGSYFKTYEQVNENLKSINEYTKYHPELLQNISGLKEIFITAIQHNQGLYITF